jgi:hypothetical protein
MRQRDVSSLWEAHALRTLPVITRRVARLGGRFVRLDSAAFNNDTNTVRPAHFRQSFNQVLLTWETVAIYNLPYHLGFNTLRNYASNTNKLRGP